MVRNYERKTQKGAGVSYSAEDLAKAVNDVKNGNKTVRGAALFYNIPRSTVQHHFFGTRGKGHVSQGPNSGGGGVTSYLSAADEEELANAIKVMEKNGFGLTGEEVLDIVQCYIVQNKLETRFKNQRPGPDWFISFRKRNRLSIKLPQSIEHSRCDQTNPWVIYDFFEKINQLFDELGLKGKPNQIYNCDETSFCHDPSKTRVVGAINQKSQRKTSASGRENTTTLLCVSGDGRMLPLLCVFKGKHVMENWVNNEVPTQTAVSASERGWMETKLFFNWFKDVFLSNIGNERPVLLLYDGHSTHISTNLIRLAQQNDVTIVKLPPHTTHVLQPLDVAVFKGLKQKWDKELCKWQRQNPRKKIPKPEFISLLTKVSQEVSPMSIINGFRTTGIYDPDPEVQGPNKKAISESVFSPTDLQKYKKELALKSTQLTIDAGPSSEEPHQPLTAEQLSTASTTTFEVPLMEEPEQSLTAEQEHPLTAIDEQRVDPEHVLRMEEPSTAEQAPFLTPNTEQHMVEVDPAEHLFLLTVDQPSTAEQEQLIAVNSEEQMEVNTSTEQFPTFNHEEPSTSKRKTFEELLLDLVKNNNMNPEKPRKKKKIVNTCEIITTAKYLEMKENDEKEKEKVLLEKEEQRKKREEIIKKKKEKNSQIKVKKDKKKPKTTVEIDESSTDSDAFSIQESEKDYQESFSEDEVEDNLTLIPGDFCVAKVFGKTANCFRLFVAKVMEKDNGGYNVSFFKRHNQTMKFKETEEESYIRESDVVRKLTRPVTASSARYNNMIGFAEDLSDLTNIH